MALQTYTFHVEMTCEGCANAVTNVLNKKQGINNVQIDLPDKKVLVTSTLSSDEILQVIKKTGKACQLLE
ncbi:antioxidant 1 copper chaperone isoform X1 [Nomia melanderi]|uniref:antioxidant 1 copper chaperone isoform X1 n=2 Tax=Nomia melanderi TaxID=2448451 RepID=UPI003FCD79DC